MAVAVHDRIISSEYHSNRNEGKAAGRKHLFALVITGCALDSKFDQGDNAHTVTRKLHLANNISTNLLFSKVRDQSFPIEILGSLKTNPNIKHLVGDVERAIKNGVVPIKVHHGLGGAYYFRNIRGENIALVKPADEEPLAPNNPKGMVGNLMGQPGLKRWVRVGETGFREVAAYILDHDHFANVPLTTIIKITHSVFNINDSKDSKAQRVCKIASLQQFIPHDSDASDYGASGFPVASVHRIGILDIRILNTDRHAGNLLVRRVHGGGGRFNGSTFELIPIDHGLCLPENLEDPYFEWIHWPQASIPFSDDELDYIAKLDHVKDAKLLQSELPMVHEACLRVLAICTIFLKEAAAFGLCLSEIGAMMSRGRDDGPSELEVVCMEARRLVIEAQDLPPLSPLIKVHEEDQFQFDVDCEEVDSAVAAPPVSKFASFRNQLWKLEETLEEEDEYNHEDDDRKNNDALIGCPKIQEVNDLPSIQRLSVSLKTVGGSCGRIGVRANHSADEQLPSVSASFVKLADMGNEEWAAFLVRVQELLPEAFVNRKSTSLGQRLGTSCQF